MPKTRELRLTGAIHQALREKTNGFYSMNIERKTKKYVLTGLITALIIHHRNDPRNPNFYLLHLPIPYHQRSERMWQA